MSDGVLFTLFSRLFIQLLLFHKLFMFLTLSAQISVMVIDTLHFHVIQPGSVRSSTPRFCVRACRKIKWMYLLDN